MSWAEARQRLAMIMGEYPTARFYGIPSGGSIVAAMTGRMADKISEADVLIDDIIDSGKTRDEYAFAEKPFVALFDKTNGDSGLGWIAFPWEKQVGTAGPTDAVVRLLEWVGEDPKRDGLAGTPDRVVRAFKEMTQGYQIDPAKILGTTFDEPCDEMIVVRDISFTSLCEHHLLPFTGTVDVAYIPGRVVGLSKLARLVDCFSRRLQIQERLTAQIADAIGTHLEAAGVAVVVKGRHACMSCRGVRKAEATMITSAMRGLLKENASARAEFLALTR